MKDLDGLYSEKVMTHIAGETARSYLSVAAMFLSSQPI